MSPYNRWKENEDAIYAALVETKIAFDKRSVQWKVKSYQLSIIYIFKVTVPLLTKEIWTSTLVVLETEASPNSV